MNTAAAGRAAAASPTGRARRVRAPDQSRRALVEAAAEIFNTLGYQGTDSNRIARAAGYAPGTFYTHFPDKLAIFLEVYRTWVDTELQAIATTLRSEGSPRTLRTRLAVGILEHHRKWRVFRASLRALSVTEERVHQARLEQRLRQIEEMAATFKARGRPVPSRARMLSTLLVFEVLCDAVADGDVEMLGIRESEVLNLLVEALGPARSGATGSSSIVSHAKGGRK